MDFKKLILLIESDEDISEFSAYADYLDKGVQSMFAGIWADWVDNEGGIRDGFPKANLSGMDILEIAPSYEKFLTPSDRLSLEKTVYSMISKFEEANGQRDITELYEDALKADGQTLDDADADLEEFIFLVLMRMQGSGISWEDDHESAGFKYPYSELSYMMFSDESFPAKNEEDNYEEEDEDDSEWNPEKDKEMDKLFMMDDEMSEWENEGEEWKGGNNDHRTSEKWKYGDD